MTAGGYNALRMRSVHSNSKRPAAVFGVDECWICEVVVPDANQKQRNLRRYVLRVILQPKTGNKTTNLEGRDMYLSGHG
jgi:hypothetical protein